MLDFDAVKEMNRKCGHLYCTVMFYATLAARSLAQCQLRLCHAYHVGRLWLRGTEVVRLP